MPEGVSSYAVGRSLKDLVYDGFLCAEDLVVMYEDPEGISEAMKIAIEIAVAEAQAQAEG